MVKFKNDSGEDFKQLWVNIEGKEYTFLDLKSRSSTKFIKVQKTYPYCPAIAITAKDTVRFWPFDYVGEELYNNRKLIMTFYIVDMQGNRRLEVRSKRAIL